MGIGLVEETVVWSGFSVVCLGSVLGWVGALVGAAEAAASGWRAGVEFVAALVDDDVMMKPTCGGEVVGVVVAALGAGDDVVGLEPVPAAAAV
jgi:hypothetical protein